MIYTCPRCHKKNRLPDTLQLDGEYRCGGCRQLLIGVSAKGEPGKRQAERAKPPPSARPSAANIRPAAFRWSAALQKKYPQHLYLTRFLRWSDVVGAQVWEARQQARLRRGAEASSGRKQALRVESLTEAWKKVPKALIWANGAYLMALLALTISNALGPELSGLGSVNLYLPQWLWAIPGGLLLLLTLAVARAWAWVPLIALLWVFGPLMGFCGKGAFSGSAGGAGIHLRIMTYNVKWGIHDGHAIAADVLAYHPDILQLQDSEGVLNGELGKVVAGWNVRISGQYIVASPHPLPSLESRDISFAGTNHHCVRYVLQAGGTPVTIYNVHLLSPRNGLVSMRHHQIGGMEGNADARLQEADRLAGYVQQESGSTLLTGDLNAPVQSLVCRKLFRAGLKDAFSESGFGYGYTYGQATRVGHPYVRIDHVLASHQWRIEHCWVGNTQGSEHSPVIADLVLPGQSAGT